MQNRRAKSPQSSNDTRRISTEWFYGLDPEQKESFEQVWRNSTYLTNQLKKKLERDLKALEIDKEDDYNNPQWVVVRADRNGQARTLRNILMLLP